MGLPAFKQVIAVNNASTTNAATASGDIDTLGFDRATIDVFMTTSDDATNNPSVLKITESDDTVVSNFAAITEFTGDGVGGFTIPDAFTSATQGVWGVKFDVDLRKRKRYLKVSVSPITTQVISAAANLYRGEEAPVNTTDAGVVALVQG